MTSDKAPNETVEPEIEDEEELDHEQPPRPWRPGTKLFVLLLVLSVVTVVGLGVAYGAFPTHSADALIQCISNAPKDPYAVASRQVHKDELERFVTDQALYFKQPNLLLNVLQAPEVKQTEWYKSMDDVDERLEGLEDKLVACPVRDSNYVSVAIRTRSANDPHKIVRKAVEIYLRKAKEGALEKWRDDLKKYQQEATSLRSQIQQKMRQMEAYAKDIPGGVISAQERAVPTLVEQELLEAHRTVTELQLQTLELEGIQAIYNNPRGPGVTARDREAVESDPQIISLRERRVDLELDRAAINTNGEGHHETLRQIDARLAALDKKLTETRDQKLRAAIQLKSEQVNTALFTSQAALYEAQDRLLKAKADQKDIESKLLIYARLTDELEFLSETWRKVNEDIQQIERIIRNQSAIQVKVVQWPLKPIDPYLPPWFCWATLPALTAFYGFLLLVIRWLRAT